MRITTSRLGVDELATAETPLLERLSPIPALEHEEIPRRIPSEKSILPLSSPDSSSFPPASFAGARSTNYPDLRSGDSNKLPQSIAHRGFSARYPENTLAAFKGAVIEAGAHALETDIHLSKDEVVVLSHDAALDRVFGVPGKVSDYTWEELRQMQTKREPRQTMCSFAELLEWLADDEDSEELEQQNQGPRVLPRSKKEDIWVLLDIKRDNDPNTVMRRIAETIRAAPLSRKHSWDERIVLGIWNTSFLPYCTLHLPSHHVVVITAFLLYARHFFSYPNISFNILQPVLMGFFGSFFLRRAQRLKRHVFAWTVNRESRMKWCISKGIDGVITDDPIKYGQVCREYVEEEEHAEVGARQSVLTWKDWVDALIINIITLMIGAVLSCFPRLSPPGPPKRKTKPREDLVEESRR